MNQEEFDEKVHEYHDKITDLEDDIEEEILRQMVDKRREELKEMGYYEELRAKNIAEKLNGREDVLEKLQLLMF